MWFGVGVGGWECECKFVVSWGEFHRSKVTNCKPKQRIMSCVRWSCERSLWRENVMQISIGFRFSFPLHSLRNELIFLFQEWTSLLTSSVQIFPLLSRQAFVLFDSVREKEREQESEWESGRVVECNVQMSEIRK